LNQSTARNTSVLGLRALRTFDAAATRLNFTKAGEDLFLTTAAVSHQIKEVESQLGVSLFTRRGKGMRLTQEGEIMCQAVREAIAALESAIRRLNARHNPDRVRVSAGPSMAAKWLVPRLESFLQQYPAADIQVDVSYTETRFNNEEVDLAICYGNPQLESAQVDPLFTESIFPVCSPRLLGRRDRLHTPQDLKRFKLIHVDWVVPHAPWPTWKTWMQSAGADPFDFQHGIHFPHTSLAIEAALAGQGIALGESSLVADDLANGRLVRPFGTDFGIHAEWAYCLISRKESLVLPVVQAFRQWLIEQARVLGGAQGT
jgi:LysR family glycine cleavage system transcriptional activator